MTPSSSAAMPLRSSSREETAPQALPELVLAADIRRRIQVLGGDPHCAPILITGETGTGKNRAARLLHDQSPRAQGPFVFANSAVLIGDLTSSALFGHVRGAFTGAVYNRKGLISEAYGGTLFLDELGSMSPQTQAQLLHVLEGGEYRRVGGDTLQQVDVRLIAAVNENLQDLIARGALRSDLLARLAQAHIHLPALRERSDLLLPLIDSIFARHAQSYGIEGKIEPRALELMRSHPWLGNIRELDSVIGQACLFAKVDGLRSINAAIMEGVLKHSMTSLVMGRRDVLEQVFHVGGGLRKTIRELEREAILEALKRHRWNITRVAKTLGFDRNSLRRKMKVLGIKRPA